MHGMLKVFIWTLLLVSIILIFILGDVFEQTENHDTSLFLNSILYRNLAVFYMQHSKY